jgi:hypothetical protein
MTEQIRRKINKGKSKTSQQPRRPVPMGILKLLESMGKVKRVVRDKSRWTRHQGPRECARRVRQMQRTISI